MANQACVFVSFLKQQAWSKHFSRGACARRDIILSTDTQITLIALPMEELLARSSNSLNLHSKSCYALAGRLHVLLSVESWKLQSSCSNVKVFQTDHISQDLLDHMAEKHGGTRGVCGFFRIYLWPHLSCLRRITAICL